MALAAFGMEIRRNGTPVAGVRSISGPSLSVDTEDVTAHDSIDAFEEAVATIIRSGEVTLEINYTPTEATHRNASGGLLNDLVSKNAATWTIVLGANTIASFSGFVTAFSVSGEVSGALTASVTIKPTGVVTMM
jgi:predicted secreted protein